jgi:hypothetical protein
MQVPRSNEAEDNIHLSVPRAQRRCAASLGALSAQYSNLAAADSRDSAQCGASDSSLRDGLGSGSECTLMRTHTFLARVSAECAGCASVSPMWTLRVLHAGHHVADRTPGWDPVRGGILRVTGTLGLISRPGPIPCRVAYQTHKQNTAVFKMPHFTPTASSHDCSMWLLLASPMRARTVPRVSTKSTRCEHAQYTPHARAQKGPCGYSEYSCGRPQYPCRFP